MKTHSGYIDPECGLCYGKGRTKGNVEMVCDRYHIPLFNSYYEMITRLITIIKRF
jgi:hypothetical protein